MGKMIDVDYTRANEYVVNKDKVLRTYIKYMLSRTQAMFSYTGLPETIPASKLELLLQTKGYAFVTNVDDNLYALYGGLGGEPDAYGEPTKITIANTALKLSKECDLMDDGVLINNDTMQMGLLPILNKYGAMLAENTISMRTVDIILRMVVMISASDDRTYKGATKFIKDIEDGKISAIGESAFFEGVRVHSVANTQNYLNQFIEMEQYLKASCFNEIGLNANFNMKAEKISTSEAAMNDDFLLPLVDNMIKERQAAIEKINEMFGTEISIDFASAWKVTHEENEKQIAISESIQEQMEQGTMDMELDQSLGAHDINKPLITIEGSENDGKGNGDNTEPEGKPTDSNQQVSENSNEPGEEETDTNGAEAEEPEGNEESNGEGAREQTGEDSETGDATQSDSEPRTGIEESGNDTELEGETEDDRDKN